MTPYERFISKIQESDGCWLWVAGQNLYGYGVFSVDGVMTMAHRLAYEMWVGSIPFGYEIDHLCRMRHCVNPTHLEVVTPYENARRGNGIVGSNLRKTHCPRGHEYSVDNTWHRKEGGRQCRACWTIKNHMRPKKRDLQHA